jgi:predicted ATPase
MTSRRRATVSASRAMGAPFLRRVVSLADDVDRSRHPFNVRAFSGGIDLTFRTNVTFFVGENGSGKSTLLEALAECCGFSPEGGSRDHRREALADRSELARWLRLSWLPKVAEGFFMRAESFYNFATYIEQVSDLRAYGGKSLHQQSPGESFLSLFANRFEQGIYILDEPEAALSPQRQLSFLKIIHDLETPAHAQFLISTHSPILLAYPGAVLFSLDGDSIQQIAYRDSDHYLVTRSFLDSPERYFKHLFGDGRDEEGDA